MFYLCKIILILVQVNSSSLNQDAKMKLETIDGPYKEITLMVNGSTMLKAGRLVNSCWTVLFFLETEKIIIYF